MNDPRISRLPVLSALLLSLALALAFATAPAAADGGGSSLWGGTSKLDPVQQLIDEQDYAGAIAELEKLRSEDPQDADVLNLLGFTHRQQGMYDEALAYYEKALEIDPEHRGALEYLGELYLQTGQPAMAEQQLARLKALCFFCRERRDLDKAIDRYREENS